MKHRWANMPFIDKAVFIVAASLSLFMYMGMGPVTERILFGTLFLLISIGGFLVGGYFTSEKTREIGLVCLVCVCACIPIFSDFLGVGLEVGDTSSLFLPNIFLTVIHALSSIGFLEITIYKIIIFASSLIGGLGCFYCGRKITNSNLCGICASALYLFSLYRICVFFYRGNIGEMLALSFVPFFVLGVIEVKSGEQRKWYIPVISFSLIIFSSPLYANITIGIIVCELVYDLLKRVVEKQFKANTSAITSIGLIFEYAIINGIYYLANGHFYFDKSIMSIDRRLSASSAYFSQMFSFFPNAQGDNLPLGSTAAEMPITIGGILLVSAVLFCIFASFGEADKRVKAIGNHCLVYAILLIVASSWLFPWNKIEENSVLMKLLASLKYPWQLMGVGTVLLVITSACGIYLAIEKTGRKEIAIAIVVVAVISGIFFFDSMSFNMMGISDKPYYAEEPVGYVQQIFY